MRANNPQPAQPRHTACAAWLRGTLACQLRTCGKLLALLATTALLTACGLPRTIDSDVQSFVGTPAAVAPATYRFERLPSQSNAAQQSALEALAATALSRVGLTQDMQQAKYVVQLSLDVTQLGQPYSGLSMRGFWGSGRYGNSATLGFMGEPVWYRHNVQLLLRDAASNQLAYETSARFEGPWSDTANLLPAILEAALAGYPNPPVGPRKVVIELPASPKP